MLRVVIADTSSLIVLQKIEKLQLLNDIFGEIIISEEVKDEFQENLPSWIKVKSVKDKIRQNLIDQILDKGEASSIALGLENKADLLIIDERKGRNYAKYIGFPVIGIIGILLKAKEYGMINSLKELIEKLENAQFWMSDSLKKML